MIRQRNPDAEERFVKNCIPRIANSKSEHDDSPPLLSVVLKRSEGGRESVQEQERESGIDVQQIRSGGGDGGCDVPMYAFVRVQGREGEG